MHFLISFTACGLVDFEKKYFFHYLTKTVIQCTLKMYHYRGAQEFSVHTN